MVHRGPGGEQSGDASAAWGIGPVPDQAPTHGPTQSVGSPFRTGPSDGFLTLRGLALGAAAAVVAAGLWATVVALTNYQIGIAAVGVALLVAGAVRLGSGGVSGTPLRLGSVGLTVVAMAVAEYLVVRHFVNEELAAEGVAQTVPLLISPLDVEGTARALAEGDLSRRSEVTGSDEMAKAAQAFDEMAPALYDVDDRANGYIEVTNRRGDLERFAIMTLSIGQGAVIMTPLKLTQAVAAFVRPDGRQVVPRLVQADAPPEFLSEYDLTTEHIAEMRKGMRMVMRAGGTAGLSTLDHWDVGGKTGTAEFGTGDPLPTHAWFVGERHGVAFETREYPCGGQHYLEAGEEWPAAAFPACRDWSDAVLLGAVGWPGAVLPTGDIAGAGVVFGLRFGLDLYVNLRPVRLYARRLSPLKDVREADIDMIVVRENTEGLYTGAGGVHARGTLGEVATQESINTRHGVERVLRYAFERANARPRRNGMPSALK